MYKEEENLYIGLDLSINDSGICIRSYPNSDNDNVSHVYAQARPKGSVPHRSVDVTPLSYIREVSKIYEESEIMDVDNSIRLSESINKFIYKHIKAAYDVRNKLIIHVRVEAPPMLNNFNASRVLQMTRNNAIVVSQVRSFLNTLTERFPKIELGTIYPIANTTIKKIADVKGQKDVDIKEIIVAKWKLSDGVHDNFDYVTKYKTTKFDDIADAYFAVIHAVNKVPLSEPKLTKKEKAELKEAKRIERELIKAEKARLKMEAKANKLKNKKK